MILRTHPHLSVCHSQQSCFDVMMSQAPMERFKGLSQAEMTKLQKVEPSGEEVEHQRKNPERFSVEPEHGGGVCVCVCMRQGSLLGLLTVL